MTALEALAGGRWRTLTILEQMGNIGSEVERTIRAHGAGRQDRFEHALERDLVERKQLHHTGHGAGLD